SAMLAYKLHQPRAADCGDFGECFNNAGAVRAFVLMGVADLVVAAGAAVRRRWEIAYAGAAATATAGLAVLVEWIFISHPPLPSAPPLAFATGVYAVTFIFVVRRPTPGTVAITASPLTIFGLVSLLALVK